MGKRSRTDIDGLSTPADDGAILIWPDVDALLKLAEANRRRRASYRFELLGRPVQAIQTPAAADGPVMMSGHQPTFFHPGVWAKQAATSALADRLGGRAEFLVVDSDALHGFALRWPEEGDVGLRVASASAFGGLGEVPFEQSPRLPSDHWRAFIDGALQASAGWPESAMAAFAEGFLDDNTRSAAGPVKRQNAETPKRQRDHPVLSPQHSALSTQHSALSYVTRWEGGMAALDRLLGLRSPRMDRVSELYSFAPEAAEGGAVLFVAHLLSEAKEFAAAYNEALAAYRLRCGVRGRRHPIPDLSIQGDRVELPLWLLHASQPRRRLSVSSTSVEVIELWAGSETISVVSRQDLVSDPAGALTACLDGWAVRPRALALTMYARLFACDLFVHGIGGAKYDQITDTIIRRFFGVEPPGYACISATLHLPLAVHPVTDADRRTVLRRTRDILFNPQRHLPAEARSSEVAALVAERAGAVEESERLRQTDPRARAARRAAFDRIRGASESLSRSFPEVTEGARHDLATISAQLEQNRIARSREWFVALYPLEKLEALRDALSLCG